jgi:hypothetical protein
MSAIIVQWWWWNRRWRSVTSGDELQMLATRLTTTLRLYITWHQWDSLLSQNMNVNVLYNY